MEKLEKSQLERYYESNIDLQDPKFFLILSSLRQKLQTSVHDSSQIESEAPSPKKLVKW